MPPLQKLISFHIVERDKHDQILMTWTYPSISENIRNYILNKISQTQKTNFIYLRFKRNWIYVTKTDVSDSEKLLNIRQFYIVTLSKDFSPYKYETLGRILSKCYYKSGNPVELVKPYLAVYTTGSYNTQENGTFAVKDFENRNIVKIKDFINLFGLEIILLYTAMLLKKRIVIYHHTLEVLLKSLQNVIYLMPHRSPNDFLYPLVDVNNEELLELKNSNWFVAGFTDSAICSKTDLFDLLVNLPALEMNVMPHAKESLTMTKTHKDIAISLVQIAENASLPESEVVKEIAKKTEELLNNLKSFSTVSNGTEKILTLNDLKSKNLHPSLENFLFNLSVAENLIMF